MTTRGSISADAEQGFEVTGPSKASPPVRSKAMMAPVLRFCVDFRGEAAARATERLPFLPPFAPAADTCARTMVELNIWMEMRGTNSSRRACQRRPRRRQPCSSDRSASTRCSKDRSAPATRATEMFSMVKKMKRLEEAAIVLSLPPTARQAGAKHRKRVLPIASSIFVDIDPGPRFCRSPNELCPIYRGNPKNVVTGVNSSTRPSV